MDHVEAIVVGLCAMAPESTRFAANKVHMSEIDTPPVHVFTGDADDISRFVPHAHVAFHQQYVPTDSYEFQAPLLSFLHQIVHMFSNAKPVKVDIADEHRPIQVFVLR